MKNRHYAHILIFLFINLLGYAQNRAIDSLQILIKNDKEDSNKVNHLNAISSNYQLEGEFENGLIYGEKALQLAEKLNSKKGIAISRSNIGTIYLIEGDFQRALDNFNISLELYKELNIKKSIGSSYGSIGIIYTHIGNYPEALKNHYAALRVREEIMDKVGVARSKLNIGAINMLQGNYTYALKYFYSSLKINREIGEKSGIAHCYNNIGIIFNRQGNHTEAIKNYFAALDISREIKDKLNISVAILNVGTIYFEQGNYLEANKFFLESLKGYKEIGAKEGELDCFINLGTLYTTINRPREAISYFNMALNLHLKIGNKDASKDLYQGLTQLDSLQGDFKSAFQHHKLYIAYRDSLNNEETKKKIMQAGMQYEYDKKEILAKVQQEKLNALNQEDKQKKRISIISISVVLVLLCIFSAFLFSRFIVARKQKIQIENQKIEIEKSYKQIRDSINYAQKIQQSILPSPEEIKEHFNDYFVYYQPKDVIGGDFYWFTKQDNDLFFASIDCTGHGVPGAILSMLGHTLLNEIVNLKKITDPYNIIKHLGEGVAKALSNKKETSVRISDGMDISVCKINIETKKLSYASVNHPIYLVDEKGLTQLSPQIKSVYGVFGINANNDLATSELFLNPNTIIYMGTDGYVDQTGGANKKKLMSGKLRELLAQAYSFPLEEQKLFLKKTFTEWKGNREQIDDVCLIGLKI